MNVFELQLWTEGFTGKHCGLVLMLDPFRLFCLWTHETLSFTPWSCNPTYSPLIQPLKPDLWLSAAIPSITQLTCTYSVCV